MLNMYYFENVEMRNKIENSNFMGLKYCFKISILDKFDLLFSLLYIYFRFYIYFIFCV